MLSLSDKQTLINQVFRNVGCPVTIQDRLSAYAAGAQAAIDFIAPFVCMNDVKVEDKQADG